MPLFQDMLLLPTLVAVEVQTKLESALPSWRSCFFSASRSKNARETTFAFSLALRSQTSSGWRVVFQPRYNRLSKQTQKSQTSAQKNSATYLTSHHKSRLISSRSSNSSRVVAWSARFTASAFHHAPVEPPKEGLVEERSSFFRGRNLYDFPEEKKPMCWDEVKSRYTKLYCGTMYTSN